MSLLSLSRLMALDPADAIALPTVITVASRKASMTEAAMIAEAMANDPLRAYLADACRKAIAEVAA